MSKEINRRKIIERSSELGGQVAGKHYKEQQLQPLEATYLRYGLIGLQAAVHTKIDKYLTRNKDDSVEQLKKAKHCLDILVDIAVQEGKEATYKLRQYRPRPPVDKEQIDQYDDAKLVFASKSDLISPSKLTTDSLRAEDYLPAESGHGGAVEPTRCEKMGYRDIDEISKAVKRANDEAMAQAAQTIKEIDQAGGLT